MLRPRASGPASGLYYRGAYAALDFASRIYELDDVSYTSGGLTSLPGFTFTGASLRTMFDSTGAMTYGPNNLLTYSEQFDNAAWTKTNSSVAQVSGAEWTLTEAATTSRKTLAETTGASQIGKVLSVEVKPNGRNYVAIGCTNLGGIWSVYSFNVSTGATVGGYTAGGASAPTNPVITSVGSGWYRVSVVLADASTSMVVMVSNGGDPIFEGYTGNGTSGLLIRKPQLEAVTYRTTPAAYMPTTSAAYYGPRLVYDPSTLASLGILVEEARTNVCLWNRDLTNAAWVAVNVTPLKDQTGIDGVANSASKITATAGNGTILQAITLASSARQQSTYIKRITGSGVIEMTADNGTTWTAVTVTASWTRVTIPVQTLANPTVGFRVVTSGDAVAIDCVQNEAGSGASSAIVTTSAAVTRAADDVVLMGLSVPDGCTAMFEANVPAFISTDARMSLSDGSTSNRITSIVTSTTSAVISATVGGSSVVGFSTTVAAGSLNKVAASSSNGAYRSAINGAVSSSGSGAVMPTLTHLDIGKNPGSSIRYWNNTIKRMRVYKTAMSNAQLQALTA